MSSRLAVVSLVVLVLSSVILAQDTGSTGTTTVQTSSPSTTSSATSSPMTTTSFSISGTILPISPPSTDPTTYPENISSSRGDRPTGVSTSTSLGPSATMQNGASVMVVGGIGSVVGLAATLVFLQGHVF